ncbi:MAG: hypothetical protein KDE48_22660 [Anaerolineales bacterium]|nr:hypothetical protein [Anaerolineales bacterium]
MTITGFIIPKNMQKSNKTTNFVGGGIGGVDTCHVEMILLPPLSPKTHPQLRPFHIDGRTPLTADTWTRRLGDGAIRMANATPNRPVPTSIF